MASDLTISAIMPAYNAARFLPRVLPPLVRMAKAGVIAEVLVVDDQSSDDTANLAAEMGAKVVETLANGGPGVARNLAAKTAVGDVLCQSRRKKGPFAGVKVGQLRCRALLGVLPIKLTRDKAHVGQGPTSIKFRPGSGSGVSALV